MKQQIELERKEWGQLQNVTLCAAAALRLTQNGTKLFLRSIQNFYNFAIISRYIFTDPSTPQKSYLAQTQRCKNQNYFNCKPHAIRNL